MPYKRFDISLAIPLDENGKVPVAVSSAWTDLIRPGILKLKQYAESVPTDHEDIEWTTRATMHTCNHPYDACTDWEEIDLDTTLNGAK